MNKQVKEKLFERVIGVMASILAFLVFFYFSSFASRVELKELESKAEKQSMILNHKIDKILQGMCIIDHRTCKLKE
jgi:hypothetical protein